MGIRSLLVCTDRFDNMAKTLARSLGAEDPTLVVLPHPIGGLPMDVAQRHAESAWGQLLEVVGQVDPGG